MESEKKLEKTPIRLCIIHNPTAGRSARLLQPTLDRLDKMGFAIDLQQTRKTGDAREWARQAVDAQDCDIVIAAGGDGTINEVVNGVAGSNCTLGVFPLGTENVLAQEIGLKPDAHAMADCIDNGDAVPVHVGWINRRAFLLMVGVGLDGRAVRDVRPGLKKKFGKVAYVISGLKQILFHAPPSLNVKIDGKAHKATWVVVSNGVYYGGKVRLAPDTSLSRAGFTVSLYFRMGRWGAVWDLATFAALRWGGSPVNQVSGAREIVITGDPEEPVQVDGDLAGTLPVTITQAESALRLLMPRAPA